MPKYTHCKSCNRNRIGKAFTYDNEMCNDCYTEYKHHQFVIYGTQWRRKCKYCSDTKNTFTSFYKHSTSIVYSNTCTDCKSKHYRVKSKKNYKRVKDHPTGNSKDDFVYRFAREFKTS